MFSWINKNLVRRFTLIFLLGCLIPALFFGIFIYYTMKNRLEQEARDKIRTGNALKEEWLLTWLDERVARITELSHIIVYEIEDPTTIRRAAKDFIKRNPEYHEIFLLSVPEGKVEVSTDISNEGKTRADRTYFKNGQHGSVIQPIYYSVTTGGPALTVGVPVTHPTGGAEYVLAARIELAKLVEILDFGTSAGYNVNSYFVNRYDAFTITRDELETANDNYSAGVKKALLENEFTGLYRNSRGERVIGNCRYIPCLGAVLVSEIGYGEVMTPLITGVSRIALYVILIILFGSVIFYLLLRQSLKPVDSLAEAVGEAASGNLNVRVEPVLDDQIGRVAKNFNIMVERLDTILKEVGTAEEKERRLIERANDAFLITDELGNILRANDRARMVWGYSEREILNKTVFELFSDESAREFGKHFRRIARADTTELLELTGRKSNGGWFPAEISAIALGDGTYLSIVRDLSEKKKLEQKLIQAQKLESVGTLASGIAHDFDNILVGVLSAASFIKSETDPADPRFEMLEVIEKSAERAAALVKQLMMFARQEPPHRESVDIGMLIDDTISFLRNGLKESVTLTARKAEKLPMVEADPIQMKQVLFNISLNARDAMPAGGELTIEVSTAEVDRSFARTHLGIEPGDYVKISISDTGVGIPREKLARIFEPFYTTKPTGKGIGLGLAVSYGIVEAHGGTITVESESGVGTTFNIYIPALSELASEERAPRPTVVAISKEPATRRLLRLALGGNRFESIIHPSLRAAFGELPAPDRRVDLIFVGSEILIDEPDVAIMGIRAIAEGAKIVVLGKILPEIPNLNVGGIIEDRYDVAAILDEIKKTVKTGSG
ncbi:hypothetical protein DRQ36_03345 [bacterium]|nr:MAG: hypothetical protein DRQ36_03345 [bacterium]